MDRQTDLADHIYHLLDGQSNMEQKHDMLTTKHCPLFMNILQVNKDKDILNICHATCKGILTDDLKPRLAPQIFFIRRARYRLCAPTCSISKCYSCIQ